ncbi:MAG: hypothetical protein U0414_09425 [Polyangiaceae bacterium]
MRFGRDQIELFERDARERFALRALAELDAIEGTRQRSDAERRAFVVDAANRAAALGLAREVEALRFVSIAALHGIGRAITPRALALSRNDALWSRPALARALAGLDPEG